MKLNEAIDIAKGCGLKTYREAYSNVLIHAMNLFVYSEIDNEMLELREELEPYMDNLDEFIG